MFAVLNVKAFLKAVHPLKIKEGYFVQDVGSVSISCSVALFAGSLLTMPLPCSARCFLWCILSAVREALRLTELRLKGQTSKGVSFSEISKLRQTCVGFQSHTADRTLFGLFCFSVSHYPSSPCPLKYLHTVSPSGFRGGSAVVCSIPNNRARPSKKKRPWCGPRASHCLPPALHYLTCLFGGLAALYPSLALIQMAWQIWPNGTDWKI